MPLLGGFFSKKIKLSSRSKQDDQTTTKTTTTTELDSNISSPTSSSYHTQYTSRQHSSNTITRNLLHPEAARAYHSNNTQSSLSVSQSSPLPAPPPPPPPQQQQQSSGHRLRLPFGRKKSNIAGSDLTSASTSNLNHHSLFSTSPRSSYTHHETSTDSQPPPLPEDPRRLRPPPSRSAIFAAYGDPNSSLSTRSLPNESQLPSSSANPLPSSPSASARPARPQNPQKRPSLFVWSKSSSSSTTPSPKATGSYHYESNLSPNPAFDSGPESVVESTQGSFALMSFRNVREPSPANNSNVSLSAPIPRPRGESINSESSQRISVAAFREAQARRSMAGSPSPSFRSPSPSPAIPQLPTFVSDPSRGRASPNPSRSSPQMRNDQNRRRSLMPVSTSESEDDTNSSDPSSEGDETMRPRISMNHTRLPQRSGKSKAKSEMGHGSKLDTQNSRNDYPVPSRPARSHTGHSFTTSPSVQPRSIPKPDASPNPQESASRPQSSLSNHGNGMRQRASASTSALTPSAAAKRASVLAVSNAAIVKADDKQFLAQPHSTQHIRGPAAISGRTDSSIPTTRPNSHSGSDSDDDAPLATLVAPRRPGSAMSSYSATYSRSTGNVSRTGHPPKPLIDINELTNPKRTIPTPEKSNDGFTSGRTLLSLQTNESFTGSHLVHSPTAMTSTSPPLKSQTQTQPLTRTIPPHKFISPPSSPPKELKQYFSDQSLAESSGASNITPPARDSSPETSRRVPLTDRLTRAVKLNTSPSTASPNLNVGTSSSPEQIARPPEPTKSMTAPPLASQSRIPGHRRLSSGIKAFSMPAPEKVDPSPPDEDLMQLLGTAGIKFISRTGESSSESSDTESEPEKQKAREDMQDTKDNIAPIPIKQRSPPPAFSVTSRPSFPKRDQGAPSAASFHTATSDDSKSTSTSPPTSFTTPRQRSSTLIPSGSSNSITPKSAALLPSQQNKVSYPGRSNPTSNVTGTNGAQSASANDRNNSLRPPGTRQRSSTMITGVPLSSQMPKTPSHLTQMAPERPFAPRRDSPASSIGDSSSGRAPLTPKDGSDIAPPSETLSTIKKRDEWKSGVSGLGVKQHIKRRSVSFEDDERDSVKFIPGHLRGNSKARNDSGSGDTSNEEDREIRRRERRRSEARAAIELGNVINGRGPVVIDDDHDDMPLNSQMSMNPMMAQAGQMPGPMAFGTPNQMLWPGNMNLGNHGMLSPAQFMLPPPVSQDQNFLVAHQQAMFFAKQAYQMAVAQQAMAAAADEWERGSAIGGFGGGGSVYGGSTASPSLMVPPYMNMNMGMNMNMMQPNQWSSASSAYMPSSSRSMYGGMMGGITSSRSEYGGGAPMGNKWSSSRSTYGESSGPSSAPPRKSGDVFKRPLLSGVSASQRDSGYFPNMPPMMTATQNKNGRASPDLRAPANNPRGRTASQPATPTRSQGQPPRKAAPPSSWKASGV